LTKEKPKSNEDQPSSTFVSATGRLHTPQGVVLVSVAGSSKAWVSVVSDWLQGVSLWPMKLDLNKEAAFKPEECAESK